MAKAGRSKRSSESPDLEVAVCLCWLFFATEPTPSSEHSPRTVGSSAPTACGRRGWSGLEQAGQ